MIHKRCDVAVIGGGPAGLAAAMAAKREGAGSVMILERDSSLGGILQQCIHPGFGLTYFDEELTGPEYAARFYEEAAKEGVSFLLDTMVLHTEGTRLTCSNKRLGMMEVEATSVVLAMGCRERTRAQIQIPGSRPAGIYTAGTAQRLINRQNVMVGHRVVILGSGDIGMIMARRLTLEGVEVVAVVEIMGYLSGLTRNRVQCLDDFSIPLLLSHTVTRIVGKGRVEGVYIAKVDEQKAPIAESERFIECDTLLLSVGLIPENELTRSQGIEMDPITGGPRLNQYQQTSLEGIFACGNVVHVNDLVDNVSSESINAGIHAARHSLKKTEARQGTVLCTPGRQVRYISPQQITLDQGREDVTLYFRATVPLKKVRITARIEGTVLLTKRAVRVNPGEMENLTISTKEFSDGQELTIDIEEVR
ncbi:MAG: FAD-dependent oxidoreductase [Spirochaetales bacterium]|nr:FAD-dependent oxidoreductase [Spirochaetales bacterium]